MNFKQYRSTETIRAAEITEDVIFAIPYRLADDQNPEPIAFNRGDFVELREGRLIGYHKDEFAFSAVHDRAPKDKPVKKRAAKTATPPVE